MDAPQGYLESFLAALYLMGVTIAGYSRSFGWGVYIDGVLSTNDLNSAIRNFANRFCTKSSRQFN